MPLHSGKSEVVQTANRRMLWNEYQKTGKVGNTRPRNRAHAMEIINAIVFSKSGRKKRGNAS